MALHYWVWCGYVCIDVGYPYCLSLWIGLILCCFQFWTEIWIGLLQYVWTYHVSVLRATPSHSTDTELTRPFSHSTSCLVDSCWITSFKKSLPGSWARPAGFHTLLHSEAHTLSKWSSEGENYSGWAQCWLLEGLNTFLVNGKNTFR